MNFWRSVRLASFAALLALMVAAPMIAGSARAADPRGSSISTRGHVRPPFRPDQTSLISVMAIRVRTAHRSRSIIGIPKTRIALAMSVLVRPRPGITSLR